MEKLKELRQRIENIEITYDYEKTYNDIYNNVIDYENETQDFDLEYLFEDFIDYEIAEERAKYELEHGGLERLRCYINDTIIYDNDIFKVDGYGNLENVYKEDLDMLKEEILQEIDRKLEENK